MAFNISESQDLNGPCFLCLPFWGHELQLTTHPGVFLRCPGEPIAEAVAVSGREISLRRSPTCHDDVFLVMFIAPDAEFEDTGYET